VVYNNLASIASSKSIPTAVAANGHGPAGIQRHSCGACHAGFDPFGLVTESYDPIGRYRTVDPEKGGPIDNSATIASLGPDLDGPVKNVNEVGQKFIAGRRASDCAATKLAKFTLDHNPDVENSCLLAQVKDNFKQSGSFAELLQGAPHVPCVPHPRPLSG
jgi:hypothetical protein